MRDKIDISPEVVAIHMERISGPVQRPQIGSLDHDTFALLHAMSDRIKELEVGLSKMRRERDRAKTEARQWKADQRKAMSNCTTAETKLAKAMAGLDLETIARVMHK